MTRPQLTSDSLILAVDASTYSGSGALVLGPTVLAECTVAMRGEREERLMPAISAMLAEAGKEASALEAIVCGGGPGSFTSLRIAASIGKGLAVALDRPLYAVPSLLLIAAGTVPGLAAGRYAVLLDAMRGDLYAAIAEVDPTGGVRLESATEIIPSAGAMEYARAAGATPIGPGIGAGIFPHARGAARVLAAGGARPVDVDLWEPDYGRLAEAQVRWEAAHGRALTGR